MIYKYPALFHDDEGKIAFHFYDIENLHSFGENLDEAILAAQEILADYFWAGGNAKAATPLEKVPVLALQVVKMIEADTQEYAAQLAVSNERDTITQAANPIRELLNRRHLKIKDLSELLNCPYRTCQDWALGKSKPPQWVLNLILEKVLD